MAAGRIGVRDARSFLLTRPSCESAKNVSARGADRLREPVRERVAEARRRHRDLVLIGLREDARFVELAGIGGAVGTPCLLQVRRAGSTRIGVRSEVDQAAAVLAEAAARPKHPSHATVSVTVDRIGRDEGKQRLCPPHRALPRLQARVADALGVGAAKPGIKPVVPDAQRDVADAGDQPLVEVDRRGLHAERVEAAFLA